VTDGRALDAFVGGYAPQFKFHDENLLMLSWYADRMVATLRRKGVRSLISLGIGHAVVPRAVIDSLGGELESYTIVEGSPLSIESFRASLQPPPNVTLEHALFEQFEARRLYDAIEMGFVLEHVDDPRLVVERFRAFLRPGGTLVVVVPNALSLHRRLGHAAGLLADPYRLSPQDLELGHRRYFDRASLESLLRAAGLRIERCEGVFLKPLTTDQLRRLQLPPDVVRAFMSVGVEHPDLCNAVYVEAAT